MGSGHMKVIGSRMLCMAMESSNGLMAVLTKVRMKRIRSMATAFSVGLMDASTRASGRTDSGTVWARTKTPMAVSKWVSGRVGGLLAGTRTWQGAVALKAEEAAFRQIDGHPCKGFRPS